MSMIVPSMMGFASKPAANEPQISGWDVSKMTYSGKNFDTSSQSGKKTGCSFSADGTKMYVLGYTAGTYAYIYQYTLSTPWDVSTASYDSVYKDVTAQSYPNARNLTFSTDGTKMYYLSGYSDTVYQYTLSTPWDVSTASYDSKSKDFSAQTASTSTVIFSTDGTKMYVQDERNIVYQYTLSTPWDVSTASYDSKSKDFSAQTAYSRGFSFSTDGAKVYISGYTTSPTYYRKVYQYTLSTPWDVSTASYDSKSKDVVSEISTKYVYGLNMSGDGVKMFALCNTGVIYQYGY